jgi:hypothetical protein
MVLVMIEIASEQLPWCMVDTLGPPGENDGDAFGEKSAFGRARERYKDAKDLCSGMHKGFENLFNWCLPPLAPFPKLPTHTRLLLFAQSSLHNLCTSLSCASSSRSATRLARPHPIMCGNSVRDMDLFNCNHEALRKLLYHLDNDLSSVAWEVTNKRKGVTHAVRQHSIDSNKENRRPALNRNKRLKLHDD